MPYESRPRFEERKVYDAREHNVSYALEGGIIIIILLSFLQVASARSSANCVFTACARIDFPLCTVAFMQKAS